MIAFTGIVDNFIVGRFPENFVVMSGVGALGFPAFKVYFGEFRCDSLSYSFFTNFNGHMATDLNDPFEVRENSALSNLFFSEHLGDS
jgi:hypothetical protein